MKMSPSQIVSYLRPTAFLHQLTGFIQFLLIKLVIPFTFSESVLSSFDKATDLCEDEDSNKKGQLQ